MPYQPTLRTLMLSLVMMILISLSLASLGGLLELPLLVHFWHLALYGILAMGLLILWLGVVWILWRLGRLGHHMLLKRSNPDSEPRLS